MCIKLSDFGGDLDQDRTQFPRDPENFSDWLKFRHGARGASVSPLSSLGQVMREMCYLVETVTNTATPAQHLNNVAEADWQRSLS